jgi:O-antigen/teichoic acid export membrane protein
VPALTVTGKFDSSDRKNLPEDAFPTSHNHLKSRTHRIFSAVLSFLLGQGALQGVNLIIGLFLVRALSVSEYAKFGLASGFQITTSILMDLGYAATIIPLVGERIFDRALVGRYVQGAKSLRNRAFWIISPFASVAFLVITYRQKWPFPTQIVMLASVLIALYSSGTVSYASVPLFLYRRLRDYYLPQTIAGICRFGVYLTLGTLGGLNSWTAAGCNAFNIAINGYLLEKKSSSSIEWPAEEDPVIRKEISRYVLPAAPAILIGAFHGQIALLLISIFGNTVGIAQVAALGRIGQLFNVLMTFNVVIVEPYMARLRREQLRLTYFRLIAVAVIGSVLVVSLAFLEPDIFLWFLGPKYVELRNLIGWVILTACINYIAGLIWIMNRSRKWLFWRGTIAELVLLLVIQVGFVTIFGVHSTTNAVMFSFASSFCYVIAHSYVAVHGFLKGERNDLNQQLN